MHASHEKPSIKETATINKKAHIIAEQCKARRVETEALPKGATVVGAVVKKASSGFFLLGIIV